MIWGFSFQIWAALLGIAVFGFTSGFFIVMKLHGCI
jgi:hypothetical protein